jgi:rod shape-determining protein MreD
VHQRPILGYAAQNRSKMIAYTVCISLLILILSVMQVTVCARLSIFGATPDLMICTVLCIAFFAGRYAGAITGIGAGFFIEALGSVGISLLPLFYLLLGYVAGYYTKLTHQKGYPVYLFYLLLTVIYRMIITVVYVGITYKAFQFGDVFVKILLPEAADTAVAGCILYFPIKALCGWLGKRK